MRTKEGGREEEGGKWAQEGKSCYYARKKGVGYYRNLLLYFSNSPKQPPTSTALCNDEVPDSFPFLVMSCRDMVIEQLDTFLRLSPIGFGESFSTCPKMCGEGGPVTREQTQPPRNEGRLLLFLIPAATSEGKRKRKGVCKNN